jgi:osmotically-inducible protein OsmY
MKINVALKINRDVLHITDLYREVLQTLKNQWEFPSDNITIRENNGWITLYGEVPWNYQREAANAAVNQLPEV